MKNFPLTTNDNKAALTLRHYEKGVRFYESGQLEKALDEYSQVIALQQVEAKEYVYAHLNSGAIYMHLGNHLEAEKLFQETIRLNPNFDKAYSVYGTLRMQQHRYEDAKELFLKALEVNSLNPKTYANLGQVYANLGLFKEAEAALKIALVGLPELAEPYLMLANVYITQSKKPEAVLVLKQGLKSIKSSTDKASLHLKLVELGDIKDGIVHLQNALKEQPNNVAILENLAHLYLRKSKLLEAEKYAINAFKIIDAKVLAQPESSSFKDQHIQLGLLLGTIYSTQGNYNKAISLYVKLVDSYPTDFNLLNNLGKSLRDIGAFADAERVLKIGLAMIDSTTNEPALTDNDALAITQTTDQPKSDSVVQSQILLLLNLGTVYESQGKLEDSQQIFEQALALDPDNTLILQNLASIHKLKGEYSMEAELLNQVRLLNPELISNDKLAFIGSSNQYYALDSGAARAQYQNDYYNSINLAELINDAAETEGFRYVE